MSNNTISKIELPNGNVYDIVDAINLGKDDNGNIISSTYKILQQIVANPTTNGETTAFIDTISQDAQGIITATKKNIPIVNSTSNGLMSNVDKTKLDNLNNFSYPIAPYPYASSEYLLLHNSITNQNTITDIATLLSSATGSSSSQGALVHYTKTISLIASSEAQTFYDDNITSSMFVIEYTFGTPSAQTDDLTITTSDGLITINGTFMKATSLTLYFGVTLTVAPTIQINLSSTTSDNILKANVTPGIFGTLNVSNGGTGAITPAAARENLGITPANIGALPNTTTAVDIGALPDTTTPADIGAVANTDIIPIQCGGTGGTTLQNAKANLNLGTATQDFIVNQPIGTNQAFGMGCIIDNSYYSARNGHRLTIIPKEESISLYDSTQDELVWDIPGNAPTVVTLGENDTTAAIIYPKLNKVKIGTMALIYMQANAVTALASKVTTSSFGIVYRMNSDTFRFFVADVSVSANGPSIHRFSSTVSASSITPGTIAFKYSGSTLS